MLNHLILIPGWTSKPLVELFKYTELESSHLYSIKSHRLLLCTEIRSTEVILYPYKRRKLREKIWIQIQTNNLYPRSMATDLLCSLVKVVHLSLLNKLFPFECSNSYMIYVYKRKGHWGASEDPEEQVGHRIYKAVNPFCMVL